MMPDTLQSLLARPDLPRVAPAINETLERERVRRDRFRRELAPSVKAEFIGGETTVRRDSGGSLRSTPVPSSG